jgi:hypothetical protein
MVNDKREKKSRIKVGLSDGLRTDGRNKIANRSFWMGSVIVRLQRSIADHGTTCRLVCLCELQTYRGINNRPTPSGLRDSVEMPLLHDRGAIPPASQTPIEAHIASKSNSDRGAHRQQVNLRPRRNSPESPTPMEEGKQRGRKETHQP